MNDLLLYFNAFLWGGTFLFYQRIKTSFGVVSGILLLYFIIALLDIHLFDNIYSVGVFKDLKIFPYIYLYILIVLSCYPLLKVERSNILYIQEPSRKIFNVVCVGLIALSLFNVADLISRVSDGLFLLFIDSEYGKEAYNMVAANYTSASSSKNLMDYNYIGILSNVAKAISPLFLVYYLTVENKNKYILIGLLFSSLLNPLVGISSGSRGALVMFSVNMLFLFLLVRKILPSNLERKIRRGLMIIGLALLIPFLAVTVSRNEGDLNRALYSLERYSAESFLRFNNYCLDANGCRNGDYTIPVVKELLGFPTARDYYARLQKYYYMKIDESVFYTFIGDFVLDYGPIYAIVIIFILSLLFGVALKIRKRRLLFHQYIIYYILMVGCLGYYQFPWGRIEGNLQLLVLLFLSLLFKFDYERSILRAKKIIR